MPKNKPEEEDKKPRPKEILVEGGKRYFIAGDLEIPIADDVEERKEEKKSN